MLSALIGLVNAGWSSAPVWAEGGGDEPRVLVNEGLPSAAHGLVVLEGGKEVLVADSFGEGGKRQIWRVGLVADEITGEMTVGEVVVFGKLSYKQPGGMAVSGDGKVVYVCDTAAGRIYVQDAVSGDLTGAIDTAGLPWNVIWVKGVEEEGGGKGLLWYVTTDGRLHRHDLGSGRTTLVMDKEAKKPMVVKHVFDLVLHAVTGEIVVTQQGEGRVLGVDVLTGVVRVLAEGFANPEGIACLQLKGKEVVFVIADTEAGKVFVLRESEEQVGMSKELLVGGLEFPICVRELSGGGGGEVVVSARNGQGVGVLIIVDAGGAMARRRDEPDVRK